ncbi:MAG: NIPSNAP family protein [Verrucomicrobiota bacterium]|jgi:hypothetical protein
MKRRDFLKTSLAASALVGAAPAALAAKPGSTKRREYYELRVYRLKAGADHDLLDGYLEKALIPALNRFGCRPVGVFTEIEPKEAQSVYVLIPYPTFAAIETVAARLQTDAAHRQAGAEYLQTPKTKPAWERIDTWWMRAFAGMPKIEQPAYSREEKPRIFELRRYYSYSEDKGQKKVDMFNAGEIETMREVGLGPIFYGQAIAGQGLPHLDYMVSAENRDAHKTHWTGFGNHPVWKKLQADPQYADTVSHIENPFLAPTAYSQI